MGYERTQVSAQMPIGYRELAELAIAIQRRPHYPQQLHPAARDRQSRCNHHTGIIVTKFHDERGIVWDQGSSLLLRPADLKWTSDDAPDGISD